MKKNAGRYVRVKKLRLLSKRIAAGFGIEDIHQFRLEVKKLRAFIRLAGPAGCRLPGKLHRVYKAVGEIRNLQLLRVSLDADAEKGHFTIPEDFYRHLDGRIVAANQEAGVLIEAQRRFRKLPLRLTGALQRSLSREAQFSFVYKKISLAERPAPSGGEDERLHSLRKSLKDILYVWPLLGNPARQLAVSDFGSRRAMQEKARLLGDYLDCVVKLRLVGDQSLFFEESYGDIIRRFRDLLTGRRADLLLRLSETSKNRFVAPWHPGTVPERVLANPRRFASIPFCGRTGVLRFRRWSYRRSR